MTTTKQIFGSTTDDIWQQVSTDLSGQEIFEYNVILVQDGRKVELELDVHIDLGDGLQGIGDGFLDLGTSYQDVGDSFQDRYVFISFKAPVASEYDFRFALHHQDLVDTVGKFFGMEDIEIGYPEFDETLIIKTNDRERTHRIFSDVNLREVFQSLHPFTLHLSHHHVPGQKEKEPFLELNIVKRVIDPDVLRNLYEALYKVLIGIEAG